MVFCVQYDLETGAICATLNTSNPPTELGNGRGQIVMDQPPDFDPHTCYVDVDTKTLQFIPQPIGEHT